MFGQVQKGINKVSKFSLKPKFMEERTRTIKPVKRRRHQRGGGLGRCYRRRTSADCCRQNIDGAMMRCLSMSIFQIIMFFVVSLVIYIACMIFCHAKYPTGSGKTAVCRG